jgi:hypothetical protein
MIKKFKTLLPLLVILSSCIKQLDYQVDEVPKKLVINSIIECFHPITVNVSCLQSILDTTLFFVNNAKVILKEEGGDIDTLNYISQGNYVSYIYGKPGKYYQLTVEGEGFPTAFAIDTIPILVPINKASTKESITVDQYGDPETDFTVSFSKKHGKTNYYELFFILQSKSYIDSLYTISFLSEIVNVDPLILETGLTDFNSASFLFSDASIADGDYTISMRMISGLYYGGNYKEPIITIRDDANAVVLRTVSKAYFDYRCSWEKHKYFKNDIAKVESWTLIIMQGEPQEMYNNIENGLGIFVSYNQSAYLF